MKIPFPDLPHIPDQTWNSQFYFPELDEVEGRFAPFVHIELSPDTPHGYNALLQRFLAALHPKNAREFPNYLRDLGQEGGVSMVYVTDGIILDGAKAFCYDEARDRNSRQLTGITLRAHMDQKSKTYPLLLIGRAFQKWLKDSGTPHKILLIVKDGDSMEMVEAEEAKV
jgi:hypothetical protein